MQQAKILVADDSKTIRAMLRRSLSTAGFDVILASDGLEAVRSARRDQPDLVILDIQMPQMDGYAACQEILSIEALSDDLPVIFLTQQTANHLVALGSQLGAYLPKPYDENCLLTTVRELLRRHNKPVPMTGAAPC